MIKTMIVDDQELLRKSLAQLISINEEISVIAMASNGIEAIAGCEEHHPDVVLMDIEMPGMDGITALKQIKERYPEIKVIILTTFDSKENIVESFLASADGFITKEIAPNELIATIQCVSYGLSVIHQNVRMIMMDKFKNEMARQQSDVNDLTTEEIEIIRLIVDGKSNKHIALALNYTEGTVKNKVSKIYDKLGMTDRLQLAVFAVANNIL